MGTAVADPQTFDEIENLYCGSVYPGAPVFKGCETALCLFSAEWLGMQDVYWLVKHGLTGTCVDLNGDNLSRMKELYPEGWEFVEADAYEYAAVAVAEGLTWDVVNLDPWTGQFGQCAELLPMWTTLAHKVVVLGHGNYRAVPPEAEGWTRTHDIMRSDFRGGVWWRVYQRA